MEWIYDDGGRLLAGFAGITGDCVVRAVAIATGMPYIKVYDDINTVGQKERMSKYRQKSGKSSADSGVYKPTIRKYIASLGWLWTPPMFIGQGCKVHLKADELPGGRLIVSVSKHITAVIDGVIYDGYNPSRNEKRCVYGYWTTGQIERRLK